MAVLPINVNINKIFSLQSETEFESLALEVFHFQYGNNKVYCEYVSGLGIKAEAVKKLQDIPFLPISFFKSHSVVSLDTGDYDKVFYSSSTTSDTPSKHIVKDLRVYKESFRNGFARFYGNIQEYCVLALLPSYLEREGSSLVYMAEDLVENSRNVNSGFYIHEYGKMVETINTLEKNGQKTLLIGVTYALLKLAEEFPMPLKHTILMETGGMKGKREELPKQEVHAILKKAFGLSAIHSEYGMTELLSQAYSKGDGKFECPPWMKVGVRDIDDPFQVNFGKGSGAINIIDLANVNSCSFIATDDVGALQSDGSFEISGRIDYSDIRGCNLMAEDL